jgi:DNA-directed RNA polymerase specialized sigma subunit
MEMENESVLREQLGTRLELAKTDKHALNTLLHDYMPFIKKCVSAVFFKNQSKTDNLTDAMLAFAHSVQTYKSERGAFIHYAAEVIHNRLIDNARSVSGLVAGANVTIQGYSSVIRDNGTAIGYYFNAKKLTFNGQTYTVMY